MKHSCKTRSKMMNDKKYEGSRNMTVDLSMAHNKIHMLKTKFSNLKRQNPIGNKEGRNCSSAPVPVISVLSESLCYGNKEHMKH